MARCLSLQAKISAGLDKAQGEDLLPESIDHHPSGRRMPARGQPHRQAQPILGRRLGPVPQQCLGHGWRNRLAGAVVAPAHEHMRLPRGVHVLHDHRGWQRTL